MSSDEEVQRFVEKVVQSLREVRLEKGLSMNHLAWMSGISQTALSYIETGKRSPTLRTLKAIAVQLEIELGTLIQKIESDESDPES